MEKLRALGRRVTQFEGFDTFEAPPNLDIVEMVSDEVTALCPVTGQPDWYTVLIRYLPDQRCIESKTLKLYLQSYRNEGMFVEAMASKIAEDVFNAIQPFLVEVEITQKPRGGVKIVAYASKQKKEVE